MTDNRSLRSVGTATAPHLCAQSSVEMVPQAGAGGLNATRHPAVCDDVASVQIRNGHTAACLLRAVTAR